MSNLLSSIIIPQSKNVLMVLKIGFFYIYIYVCILDCIAENIMCQTQDIMCNFDDKELLKPHSPQHKKQTCRTNNICIIVFIHYYCSFILYYLFLCFLFFFSFWWTSCKINLEALIWVCCTSS